MKFSKKGRAGGFFFYSLAVFDLHVKQTTLNINTSILYPGLFLLYVIDIPVSVLRSPWEKSKVGYHSWQLSNV